MNSSSRENLNANELLEQKLLEILKKNLNIGSGIVVIPKYRFNLLASRVRITPKEILRVAKDFSRVKIATHSYRLVEIAVKSNRREDDHD